MSCVLLSSVPNHACKKISGLNDLSLSVVEGNILKIGSESEPEKRLGGWVTDSTVGSNRDVIIM